jgi:hypothetical protein
MRPLLGDFLAAVSKHLDAATGDLCLGAEASPSVVGELFRLTAVMAHCADAFTAEDQSDSRHLKDARDLAMADARSALAQAAARMRAAWGAHPETDDDSPPAAMCLAAAADNLAAGVTCCTHTSPPTSSAGDTEPHPGPGPSRPSR